MIILSQKCRFVQYLQRFSVFQRALLIVVVLVILILLGFLEARWSYPESAFRLNRIDNPDNSYYFKASLSPWQGKQREELLARYKQGTIIECEDGSVYSILKPSKAKGELRFIAKPYIIQEKIPIQNITLNISNQGSLFLDFSNNTNIYNTYQEIFNSIEDSNDKIDSLDTLERILNRQSVEKNALVRLRSFLEKHSTEISGVADMLSIIASIGTFIKL